jgi:hypothetical protein
MVELLLVGTDSLDYYNFSTTRSRNFTSEPNPACASDKPIRNSTFVKSTVENPSIVYFAIVIVQYAIESTIACADPVERVASSFYRYTFFTTGNSVLRFM